MPVIVLSRLFRRLFLESSQQSFDSGKLRLLGRLETLAEPVTFAQHCADLKGGEWVVYAKRPFAGPRLVLDYVGRYTHRVATSIHRLLEIENDQVVFHWKDYRMATSTR